MIYAVGTFLFSFFLLCNCVQYCYARDNITTDYCINDNNGETLVSAGNKFQLGFFAPNENSNKGRRYIGIWYYKINPQTIVWVCNRDQPILGGSGIFGIDGRDGNLKLFRNTTLIFSTGLNSSLGSLANSSSRTVKLLDNGNLVLIDDRTRQRLWQSFDNPTDTFLPGMKMNKNLTLTAWKNRDDPAKGDFVFRKSDQQDDGSYMIMKKARTYWKSGEESSGGRHLLVYPNKMNQFATLLLSNNSNHDIWKKKAGGNFSNSRLVMDSSGEIRYLSWDRGAVKWSQPQGPCSAYNTCGDFSICNSSDIHKPTCKCFRGFELVKEDETKSTNFSSGCNRKSDLCSAGKQDNAAKFFNVNVIKVEPPTTPPFDAKNETECREACLGSCRCQAYYYCRNGDDSRMDPADNKNSCWTWMEDLTDIQIGYADGRVGYNLSIKIASSDYDQVRNPGPVQSGVMQPKKKKSRPSIVVIIPTSLIVAVILFCSISYFCYRRLMTNRKDQSTQQHNALLHLYDDERRVKNLIDQDDQFREDDKKDIDVPFFQLENILAATDNFSLANKLGQGGFGPVYKGKLPGGEEIAIKRLSGNSLQGLKEFKNEVVLIAKLQHRNLVRLLGYCVDGNEKILLYEYMPNKSLDAFIFDEKQRMLLDWKRRFDIILGVARGLLYLHQDSRLRIIHRDMKASNILLDEEMNPKISDFGLARIVGGRETEANTNRVVGTYGYMSPEYALDGQFSVKSDAFSFGVVVLEIICGKRNTGFYESELNWNLLGYAWNLWKEEKPLALLDETLVESCNEREVLKCIIIGLLCVQEDPGDRPTMSKVLFMLNSELETLPNPKQPAFVSRKRLSGTTPASSSTKPETISENEITMSMDDGR